MKTLIIFILTLNLFEITISKAQQEVKGIYLSAADFTSKKLTHISKHTRVKFHEVFKKNIIEIKCNDTNYVYQKEKVYGYREKTGEDFRIVNNLFYLIVNPNEKILLYKKPCGIPQKGQEQMYAAFFSKSAEAPIQPLTLKNLESTFVENTKFAELLEIHFKNDNDLLEYDNTHKMYKLNRLYELSITN